MGDNRIDSRLDKRIKRVKGRKFKGEVFRAVRSVFKKRVLDTEGALLHGGRYNRKMTYGALYCASTAELAKLEIQKRAEGGKIRKGDFVVARIRVSLSNVLDLRSSLVVNRLGVDTTDLTHPGDYGKCQRIADIARKNGFEAILAQSAVGDGWNLVLFPDRFKRSSKIHLSGVPESFP